MGFQLFRIKFLHLSADGLNSHSYYSRLDLNLKVIYQICMILQFKSEIYQRMRVIRSLVNS